MNPIALVTGSAGFVGRHMATALTVAGFDVTGVDVDTSEPWQHQLHAAGGQAVVGDARWWLRDSTHRYDLVVHCAAVVGGRTMIDGAPLRLAAEDLSIDAELFRWLLRQPGTPPKVVYFSSSAAYPIDLQSTARADQVHNGSIERWAMQLHEDAIDLARPRLPDQTYGWVKLTGERLAAEAQAMGLPVYVFRPFSGYGADQDIDYPFPMFIERARALADPFGVWGPGTQVRDFVHISDVVGAVSARLAGDDTSPVNIGTGRATTFLNLARLVTEAAGYQPEIVTDPAMPVGVAWRVASTAKLNEFYAPKITLEQGIDQALAEAHES